MDITYTSKFDATRYERLIDRALGLGTLRVSFFCWCMAVFGVLSLYDNWARHYDFGVWDWLYVILAVNPLLVRAIRRFQARQYLMVLQRVMCGATASRCRLTDEGYEVSCGETSQKMSWKSLALEFHFFDDDTVALLQVKGLPSLVLFDLSRHGIARKELESVLLQAGVKERRASGLRKFWTVVSGIVGFLFVIVASLKALGSLISPCGHGQLVFSNESAVSVAKALVSFGRNAIELKDIPSRGQKFDDFFVGGACNCHVVATLADGLVVSNSYGYYCHGHDWGRVDVIVTQDKRIKIVDKYYREDIERKRESGETIEQTFQ